jgi:hypothetical protein
LKVGEAEAVAQGVCFGLGDLLLLGRLERVHRVPEGLDRRGGSAWGIRSQDRRRL